MIELNLEMAEKAVKVAMAKAKELGTPMTVSVVDEAGRLVVTARGNGAGPFTPETSRAKAVAAAAFRRSNKEMVELHRTNPFWGSVSSVLGGQVLTSLGGAPITRSGRVVGGVGCGGGTGEQDQECAEAAAAALQT